MTEGLFSRAAAIPVGHNNKKTVQSIKGAGWNFLFISSWLHSPAVLKFVHVTQEDTQNILQQYAIGWEKMKFHTVVTPSTVMHVDPLECFLLSSLLHKALKCGHTEKKKKKLHNKTWQTAQDLSPKNCCFPFFSLPRTKFTYKMRTNKYIFIKDELSMAV